jgi:hypothetical protein
MIIDCGSCAVAGLACDVCVVSVLLGTPDAIGLADFPADHAVALEVLAGSGLIPPLRLVPRSQAS